MRPNGVREAWAKDQAALGALVDDPQRVLGRDHRARRIRLGLRRHAARDHRLRSRWSRCCKPCRRPTSPRSCGSRGTSPASSARSLDAGARGVIIPMVNSRADAEHAVRACRYAPRARAATDRCARNYYAGFDYFAHANDDVLCIVMIETATRSPTSTRSSRSRASTRSTSGPPTSASPSACRPRPTRTRELHRRHRAHRRVVPTRTASCRASQATRRPRRSASNKASGWSRSRPTPRLLGGGAGQALHAVAPDRAADAKSSYL